MAGTAEEAPIRVSVELSQTINLGDYNSAKVSIGLSEIPSGATEEDVEAALGTGGLVYEVLKREMRSRIQQVTENIERG